MEYGFKPEITSEQYHSNFRDFIPGSGILAFLECPYDYYWGYILGNQKKTTSSLFLGKAAHMAVLEPQKFKSEKFTPAIKKKAAEMGEVFLKHNQAFDMVMPCHRELAGFFEYSLEGRAYQCRILLDGFDFNEVRIVEYKTIKTLNSRAIELAMVNYSYHIKAAFYRAGVADILSIDPSEVEHRFIFQESSPPYKLQVFDSTPTEELELGRIKVEKALKGIGICLDTNNWPMYTGGNTISLPAWYSEKTFKEEIAHGQDPFDF